MVLRYSLIGEDTPVLKRIQRFARAYPELALKSARDNIVPFVDIRVDRQLRRNVPGKVKRPIRWTSEKQRRAYFATDGFGAGIPYKRTGRLPAAWRVESAIGPGGLTISITNPSKAAPFVYGRWKQQFHTDTGWPDARPIIDKIIEATRPALVEDQILLARALIGGR
jgi:hypothetical protein